MKNKLIDMLLVRKLDGYLLKNYPAVWKTRGHLVLFYSLLIGVISFLVGYGITSTKNLTVPPIRQLFLNNDGSFILSFGIAVLSILYWIFTQKKTQKQGYNFSAFLISLLIYLIGTSSILLFNTTAYRLGTIYKSKGLMEQEDINTLKANHFYMYGLVYSGDTLQNRIEAANQKFIDDLEKEEEVLKNRYFSRYLSNVSEYPFYSDFWNQMDNFFLQGRSNRSYLSYLSIWLSDLYYFDFANQKPKISRNEDYTLKWSYFLNDAVSKIGFEKNHFFITDINKYAKDLENSLDKKILDKYNITRVYDKLEYKKYTFYNYPHLFYLEDIAWSTQHAQLYLNEGIWYKNTKMLLPLILFFSLLFVTVEYSKIEELTISGLLMTLALFVSTTFANSENESAIFIMMIGVDCFYPWLVFASVHNIVFAFTRQKLELFYYTLLIITFVLLGILLSSILGLYIIDKYSLSGIDKYSLPGLNFCLTENLMELYLIPLICAFIWLFVLWFINQKPWAR